MKHNIRDSHGRFTKSKFPKGDYFVGIDCLSTREFYEPKTKYVLSSKDFDSLAEAKKRIMELDYDGVLDSKCKIYRVDRKYSAKVKTDVLVKRIDL